MTNPDATDRSRAVQDECFRSLADATRREVVRIVHERSPSGIETHDLVERLAAVTNDVDPEQVTDAQRRRAHVECHHRALPALVDAGILAEREDGTVRTTDHWAFESGVADRLVRCTTDGHGDEAVDAVFDVLTDSRRRHAITALGSRYGSIETAELARAVAARESDAPEPDVSSERVDRVHTALVHVHLPILADAGLVSYDAEASTVSYEGHPSLYAISIEDDSTPDSDATDVVLVSNIADV